MRPPDRVLFLALAGAGDTLLATPLMREVRAAWPRARVEVLTMQGPAPRQALENNPDVDEVMHFDFLSAGRHRSVLHCLRLRRRRYDLSFTPMPHNRLEYNLITWLIGARERVGFEFCADCGAQPRRWLTRVVREDRRLHVVDNNLRLWTEGLGRPLCDPDPRPRLHPPPEHLAAAAAWVATPPRAGRRLIGLHPGSGTTKNLILKRWPLPRWATLARRVATDDDVHLVVFGSRDEAPLRHALIEASGLPPSAIGEAPEGPVLLTAAAIGHLSAFVCGDTLLTHVAAAMRVPTVEIVGPTDPAATGPYKTPHRIVRLGLPCSPCYFFSKHGIRCTHERPMACLTDLEPERVEVALRELLRAPHPARDGTAAEPGHGA